MYVIIADYVGCHLLTFKQYAAQQNLQGRNWSQLAKIVQKDLMTF